MKILSTLLLLSLSIGLTTTALAQTKTPAKPTNKSTTSASKTTTPKSKATKKASTTKSTTARPASKPATSSTPPATDQSTTSNPVKLEIPGVEPQKAPSFNKGTVAVNLGLGLGIGYGYGYGYSFGGSTKSSPAVSLSAEKGLVDGIGPGVISVGGLLGYKSYSYEWSSYKTTWTNVYLAARGAYHYNFTANPKLDTYAGLSLAARIENYSSNYEDDALDNPYGGVNLEVGVFAGGRYLLTNKVGAFAELGYDMSYMKLGLTAKF